MSLKSRKRVEKNKGIHHPGNPLLLQKQVIKKTMLKHLIVAAVFLVIDIAAMMIGFLNETAVSKQTGLIVAGLVISAIFIHYLVSFILCFSIFRQLSKIKDSTEQSVAVCCRKVLFFLRPVSRFSSVVLCIVLIDGNGSKFCYVYPEKNAPSHFSKKYMKTEYTGRKVELICYQDTNMVKILPSQHVK